MNYHKINIIRSTSTISFIFMMLICLIASPLSAQHQHSDGLEITAFDNHHLEFVFTVNSFYLDETGLDDLQLQSKATNSYSNESGKPQLPQYRQIVVIPCGTVPEVTSVDKTWEKHNPTKLAAGRMLTYSNGPRFKNDYETNSLRDDNSYSGTYQLPTVEITPLGTMRNKTVALLTISPFSYKAAEGEIGVCHRIEATITFQPSNKQQRLKATDDVMFEHILQPIKPESKEYHNNLYSNVPFTYLVVAPERFGQSLQPFISWKRQEGYIVEEMYTSTTDGDTIRAAIQRRFDNSSTLHPAPLFILIAADNDEIPPFIAQHRIGGLDVHSTDLYYAEFTGDYLPDALIGRMPARDTVELNTIISKTLEYEKYLIADTSHIGRSLLVAGAESQDPAPTVTNGQVNYLKNCLMQIDPGHDTMCYYNPESDSLGEQIMSHIRQGVGFVNFTSHCNAGGWIHPRIGYFEMDTLNENGHYFLSINNCCKANALGMDCFGKHLIRKPNGGAIGVIGAANETMWEEDYYWSVGNQASLTLNPQYNSDGMGAYDRLFHLHGEEYSQQSLTQSQIVIAGNWAVTRSGSRFDAFYWEIYNLLGDPSLMPYIGTPESQVLSADPYVTGDVSMALHGTPYARVAATWNDTLYGVCTLDSEGEGTIIALQPFQDSITLTATTQYHKPLQTIATSGTANGARVVALQGVLTDSHGNSTSFLTLEDSTDLTLTLRNVGNTAAVGHSITIHFEGETTTLPINTLQPGESGTATITLHPTQAGEDSIATIGLAIAADSTYWQHQMHFDIKSYSNVGIDQPQMDYPEFSIYPNPAHDRITITGFNEATHITIFDCMGRIVKDFSAQKGETVQYSTQQLRCGIYSVLFSDSQHRETKKLLITR